jgi:ELWxxDGT repeat protein
LRLEALENRLVLSDSTGANVFLVKDILAGSESSSPAALVDVNGTLFFTATDGINGNELWKSDSTAAGTVLVKDINSDSAGSGPSRLTNVNGTLFFTANDGTNGWELWKSDGTEAGTVLVKDLTPGSGSSYLGKTSERKSISSLELRDGHTDNRLPDAEHAAGFFVARFEFERDGQFIRKPNRKGWQGLADR